ncbi:MAG: threonine synthase [Bacteroidota bacterium]|nr:threonine synthase [Bacteroidota bacterium]
MSKKFIYRCNDCHTEYNSEGIHYLCPKCARKNSSDKPPLGVLKVIYDYDKIATDSVGKHKDLLSELGENNFLDLLPIKNSASLPNLNVGNTPLYKHTFKNNKTGCNLFFKDDSQNPTYSYKDRASAIVSAFAKENGIDTIVAASTGNAGSSLAGICAVQNQKAVIMVPEKAPKAKLTQIMMYGAEIVPVKGTYDDAFDLSIAATKKFGWYNRNTAYNPLTIEGKKTAAFELCRQMPAPPDYVFVPVGDGCIIAGIYKGFEDLLQLGIIKTIPVIVAVQSSGSNNLVANMNDTFTVKPADTLADSISVDIPRNFYMARNFIRKYKGKTIEVSDNDILHASKKLSKTYGLFSEPAAATAYAGFLAFAEKQNLPNNSNVAIMLTGSGLKDLDAVQPLLQMPKPIEADIEKLSLNKK